MTALALDSSGAGCSAALWHDDRVIAVRRIALARGHAAALMPLVRDTVVASGFAWSALTAIAVTVGPGSFTGIRVGLAAARGLGLALGVPVRGVTSFEAIAWAARAAMSPAAGTFAVLIDSGRASCFLQAFDGALRPLGPAAAVELGALPAALPPLPCTVVAAGPLAREHAGGRPIVAGAPDAAAVAALAAARHAEGAAFLPASPLYLRAPDATVPRAGGRLRA